MKNLESPSVVKMLVESKASVHEMLTRSQLYDQHVEEDWNRYVMTLDHWAELSRTASLRRKGICDPLRNPLAAGGLARVL